MKDYRIILADDHHLFRAGIKSLISDYNGLKIVAEATNGEELLEKVTKIDCDMVITDLSMPKLNGLEAIDLIRKEKKKVKIIVLTMHKEKEFFRRAIAKKIDGYLLKTDIYEKVISTIKIVQSGGKSYSEDLAANLAEDYGNFRDSEIALEILTKREKQVLRLVAKGYKNRDIADDLEISIRTVETHRSNLMEKLDLENVQDLIRFAIEKGIG